VPPINSTRHDQRRNDQDNRQDQERTTEKNTIFSFDHAAGKKTTAGEVLLLHLVGDLVEDWKKAQRTIEKY